MVAHLVRSMPKESTNQDQTSPWSCHSTWMGMMLAILHGCAAKVMDSDGENTL